MPIRGIEGPVEFEQVYNAPIDTVWQALTDENQMRAWYFPQLEKFSPVEGFAFVFSTDGSPFQKEWRVTKVVQGRLLAHSWTYHGYDGSSEVVFELFPEATNTRLRLTHTGINSFPADHHFARSRFESGWKQILATNLRLHLENKA